MTSPPTDLFASTRLQMGVLTPRHVDYIERQESYWSSTSKSEPAYIVRPTSTGEVSAIINTLVSANQQFAVRSGGHMQWHGANNIKHGVQIDLCFLNWTKLDQSTGIVDLGPGACWKDVYAELEKYGRMVAGGRNGKIGVGGLLLGGGMTFFTGRRGFACDDVLAYEVVLANGRIVTADGTTNSDLFFALKGGSGNFGIVTNFKMRSFENTKIWAGLRILSKEAVDAALGALQDFTAHASEDFDSNLLVFIAKMGSCKVALGPDQADIHVIAAMIQVAAVENAPAFKNYLEMPAVMDSTKVTTVREIVTEYDPVPCGYYNFFYTISVKNDVRIFRKAAELHEQVVEDLKLMIPDGNFLIECLFQPLPKHYGQKCAENGIGNVMGISSNLDDGVLFVAIVVVQTSEQEKFAFPKGQAWGEAVRNYAASIENGLLPWVYMNYADGSQDPLRSYGAENVKKMKEAAAKYDPRQVFQKLCPGGFKILNI